MSLQYSCDSEECSTNSVPGQRITIEGFIYDENMQFEGSVTDVDILEFQDDMSMTTQSVESITPSFTLFPNLPPEIRLRILNYLLPGDSVKYVEIWDEPMFGWDSTSKEWVVSMPFVPLLHVNRECRYEAMKHYLVMKPQEKGHSGIYYPLGNVALVFRYRSNTYGWWMFNGWVFRQAGGLLKSIKHLVFEQPEIGPVMYGPNPEIYTYYPGMTDFWSVDWSSLSGLESFVFAYLCYTVGDIVDFAEDADTESYRQRQAELIVFLVNDSGHPWMAQTRIGFGSLVFADTPLLE